MQDQILTLTITAVDPVAFALTWMLAWVARMPEVQSALHDELTTLRDDPSVLALLHCPTCGARVRKHCEFTQFCPQSRDGG